MRQDDRGEKREPNGEVDSEEIATGMGLALLTASRLKSFVEQAQKVFANNDAGLSSLYIAPITFRRRSTGTPKVVASLKRLPPREAQGILVATPIPH